MSTWDGLRAGLFGLLLFFLGAGSVGVALAGFGSAQGGGGGFAPSQGGGSGSDANDTPGQPGSFTVTQGVPTTSVLDYTWTPAPYADGYKLEIGTLSGGTLSAGYWVEEDGSNTAAGSLSYSATGLTSGTAFQARLTALNLGTEGTLTLTCIGTTDAATVPPTTSYGTALLVWYQSDDASTLTTSGTDVTSWENKAPTTSGSYDLSAYAGGAEPGLDSGAVNGRDAILFDDSSFHGMTHTDEWSPGDPLGGVSKFYVWVVFVSDDATYNGNAFSFAHSGFDNRYDRLVALGGTAGDPLYWQNTGAGAATTTTGFTAGTAHIAFVHEANTSRLVQIDGAGDGTESSTGGDSTTRLGVGYLARQNATGWFSGHICEVIVVDATTEASAQDLTDTYNYLADRWQFVFFLPGFGFVCWDRRKRRPLTLKAAA